MDINLKNIIDEKECEDYKEIVSRVGVSVVCNDEDEKELSENNAVMLPDTEECESVVEVASKIGMQIVCSDDDEE